MVVHCYRERESVVRIISARKATKREIRSYEEGIRVYEVARGEKSVSREEEGGGNQPEPAGFGLFQSAGGRDGDPVSEVD